MLFDLRGKRRRLIQVSFLLLAIIFGASFIVSFVGSGLDVGGSVADLFGDGSGSSLNSQVEKYQKRVKRHPSDEKAWLELTRAHYSVATSVGYDSTTGQFTEEAKSELRATTRAWENYLKLEPKRANASVASLVVRAYGIGLEDFDSATETQQIVTKARPSASTFGELARYAYFAGKTQIGDAAAKRAVELSPKSRRKFVKRSLDQIKKQAAEIAAQEAKAQIQQQ